MICTNPDHDHTTIDDGQGGTLPEPVPMRCQDCRQPAHYDQAIEDYQHDDPTVGNCFLIRLSTEAGACGPASVPDRAHRVRRVLVALPGRIAFAGQVIFPLIILGIVAYHLLAAIVAQDWTAVLGTLAGIAVPVLVANLVVYLMRRRFGRRLLDLMMRDVPADDVGGILAACAASHLIGPRLVAEYRRDHEL